jgi:hypothetical protein
LRKFGKGTLLDIDNHAKDLKKEIALLYSKKIFILEEKLIILEKEYHDYIEQRARGKLFKEDRQRVKKDIVELESKLKNNEESIKELCLIK